MTVPAPPPDDTPTESAVTRAVAELDGLPGRPLSAHVDAFERMHVALGEALAAGASGPA